MNFREIAGTVIDSSRAEETEILAMEQDESQSAVYSSASPFLPPFEAEANAYRIIAPVNRQIDRLIVLKLDHRGDFMMAMPAFRILRHAFPAAGITLVCGSWNRQEAEDLHLFDRVIAFDFFPEDASAGPSVLSYEELCDRFAELVAGESFDAAIDLRLYEDTRELIKSIDARHRAGFDPLDKFPWLTIPLNLLIPSRDGRAEQGVMLATDFHTRIGEHHGFAMIFLRQPEMVTGPIQGTVDILAELRARGVPLYALSNWSAETFPLSLKRFDFLRWFQGILLSGEVRLIKPDPRIFQLFLSTHAIDPAHAVYIDDLKPNVDAAAALGMRGILFTDPPTLRSELVNLGLLDPPPRIDHAAAWVFDLERARAFYERWFKATAAPMYTNSTRNFKSRFLWLGSGTRLELMTSPGQSTRMAHLAISVGSREAVNQLVNAMETAGVHIVSRPRLTGDGYYEAVIADSEGNLIEITG